MTLGTLTGLASGYYGGVLDEIAMRFVDIWFAVPFLLIALVVAITIGTSVATIMWLLAFATWVGMVRNIRADVLSLKTRDYVDLARVAGASDWRIMLWHILPRGVKYCRRSGVPSGGWTDPGRVGPELPGGWHPRQHSQLGPYDLRWP